MVVWVLFVCLYIYIHTHTYAQVTTKDSRLLGLWVGREYLLPDLDNVILQMDKRRHYLEPPAQWDIDNHE